MNQTPAYPIRSPESTPRRGGAVITAAGAVLALAAGLHAEPVPELRSTAARVAEFRADAGVARDLSRGGFAVVSLAPEAGATTRRELAGLGVKLGQRVGDGLYTARLEPGAADRAATLAGVTAVRAYRDAWKIDPTVGRRAFATAERIALRDAGRVRLTVHIFEHARAADEASVVAAIVDAGGEVFHVAEVAGNRVLAVEGPAGFEDVLAAADAVQWVEEAPEIVDRNLTARAAVQSGVAGSTPLNDQGLTGLGQVVAVMDSGIDQGHCSFTGPGKLIAVNNNPGVTWHGTHVAATVAGDSGVSDDLRGHAYDAELVFTRRPAFTQDDLLSLLELQSSQGAAVHNNSWGDDNDDAYNGMARAIDAFMHNDEDQLVVFAVSNSATIRSPENAKNVLSVAATRDFPDLDSFCSGGRGGTSDGRLKPDLTAPGCGIFSASSGSTCGVRSGTGTSMAAPAVTGVAALVRQYFTDGFYPTGAADPADALVPSGALLKAALINSATGLGGVPDGFSNFPGWGRVLADDVLYFSAAGDDRRLWIEDLRNAAGLATGSVVERTITSSGEGVEPMKVTLVWTDPPPAPGAAEAWVNDLDLEVVSPGGTTYLGNVFAGGVSVPGGVDDDVNNVEQVLIAAPADGTWTVRVVGASVPEGPQGFALVVTGDVSGEALGPVLTPLDPPELIASGGPGTPFDVAIDGRDDALVPGSPALRYRYDGSASFESSALAPLGGGVYRATLPAASCGHAPEWYVEAVGAATGAASAPPGAPLATFDAAVATTQDTVVFAEDFEGAALPADWSTTPGSLWNIGASCEPAPLGQGGAAWAYFGSPGTCSYSTGSTEVGSIISAEITLPPAGPGSAITLEYDSAMENENVSRYDRGFVLVAGSVVDQAPHTASQWERRSVDLGAFAGQTVRIEWLFDSVDSSFNDFEGWRVDNISVVATAGSCADPCPGDVDGDLLVTVSDFFALASAFGSTSGATRSTGDLTGDGAVDVSDFFVLASAFGSDCTAP